MLVGISMPDVRNAYEQSELQLFQLGQTVIIDLSRVQQWRRMYDLKHIVAPQRYAVARFVLDTVINDEEYWVFTLYSSAHGAYIMTLPIPKDEWELVSGPEPFFSQKIPFLTHIRLEQYDMGRPISVEFLFEPLKALKKVRDQPLLLVLPSSRLAPLPVDFRFDRPYPSTEAAEHS